MTLPDILGCTSGSWVSLLAPSICQCLCLTSTLQDTFWTQWASLGAGQGALTPTSRPTPSGHFLLNDPDLLLKLQDFLVVRWLRLQSQCRTRVGSLVGN